LDSSRPLISSIKRNLPRKMEQMEISPIRMQICTLAISVVLVWGQNNMKPMSSTKKRTTMHLETLKVMLSQRMKMMEVGMLSSRRHLSQLNWPSRRQKVLSLIKKSKPVLKNDFQNQMKMTKKNLGTSRRPMTPLRIRRKKTTSETSVTLTKPNRKNMSISKKQKIKIAIRLTRRSKNRYQSKMLLSQRIKKRKPQRLKTKKMNLVTSVSSMNSKKSNQLRRMKKMTISETSMISRLTHKKLLLPA